MGGAEVYAALFVLAGQETVDEAAGGIAAANAVFDFQVVEIWAFVENVVFTSYKIADQLFSRPVFTSRRVVPIAVSVGNLWLRGEPSLCNFRAAALPGFHRYLQLRSLILW